MDLGSFMVGWSVAAGMFALDEGRYGLATVVLGVSVLTYLLVRDHGRTR